MTNYVLFPCDLKTSNYECLFFKNPDGCRGVCVDNGKPCCEYCKLKELPNLEVEKEDD